MHDCAVPVAVPDVPVVPAALAEPLDPDDPAVPVDVPLVPPSGVGVVKQPDANAAEAKAKENTKCFKGDPTVKVEMRRPTRMRS